MSAKYWIARYIEDVFRNEPRNVGVVVRVGDEIAARFVGERDDGFLDKRKLAGFSHPDVYSQWHDYWRREIATSNIDGIVREATANYLIAPGGEVSDIGNDQADDVCQFLFSALVGHGGLSEAFKWEEEETADQSLSGEVIDALKRTELLADQGLFVRHPVKRNENVVGKHVVHVPSLSQRNGKLYVFETIDLSRPKQKHVRERSGWMAYMFADIKEADRTATAYSLLRPSGDGGEAIEFARSVLAGESQLVNWSDQKERGAFLEERRKVADAV